MSTFHVYRSLDALKRASVEELENIGILKGNAIFLARHSKTIPPEDGDVEGRVRYYSFILVRMKMKQLKKFNCS